VPEGDTIAKSALTLAGVLVGRRVTGFRSSVAGVEERAQSLGVVGSAVQAVEARGKHLLMHFRADGAASSEAGAAAVGSGGPVQRVAGPARRSARTCG
jgi:formamidopyrimidine-DNA glycosylase